MFFAPLFRKILSSSSLDSDDPQLFQGVTKPSIILIDMVLADVIKNIDKITHKPNKYDPDDEEYEWSNDKASIKWKHLNVHSGLSHKEKSFKLSYISFRNERFELTKEEENRIQNRLRDITKLSTEFEANLAESKRQQNAVDLIETLFKAPAPKPVVKNETTTEDSDDFLSSIKG